MLARGSTERLILFKKEEGASEERTRSLVRDGGFPQGHREGHGAAELKSQFDEMVAE